VAGNALATSHVALNHDSTLRAGHSLLGSLLRTFLRNSSFNGHFVFYLWLKIKKNKIFLLFFLNSKTLQQKNFF